MLKIENVKTITVQNWDQFVQETYGRPYKFQQQEGCKDRGVYNFDVSKSSEEDEFYDFQNDTVPEEVNHSKMGVSFKAWLARDPKQLISSDNSVCARDLWWYRNFYPSIEMVANDLCKKNLLEEGEYMIVIDW
jgi:hypothetical protein